MILRAAPSPLLPPAAPPPPLPAAPVLLLPPAAAAALLLPLLLVAVLEPAAAGSARAGRPSTLSSVMCRVVATAWPGVHVCVGWVHA
jgi:hypothetical protein